MRGKNAGVTVGALEKLPMRLSEGFVVAHHGRW